MARPTGSVYLDTPTRPSRRPTAAPKSRTRSVVAGGLVAVGLLGLTVGLLATGLRMLILEPDPVINAFEASLDDPLARIELEQEFASAIEAGFVGDELAEVAEVWGFDVKEEAGKVSLVALDDPGVRLALIDLITEVHSRALIEPRTDDIDLSPISDAVLAVIRQESPELADIIPPGSTLWTIDADTVPDLTSPTAALDRLLMVGLIAAIGVPLGAVVHTRRHRIVAWVGRWALVMGLMGGLAAVGLPYLGGRVTGWSTVEIAIRATTIRLIAPAAMAGIIGMGLVSVAAVAQRREKRLVMEEGTAAALGYDEPRPWTLNATPTLDLPGRSLIDANRPLTNI